MSHRQNGCDVHLKYAAISRRHATLALQKSGSVRLPGPGHPHSPETGERCSPPSHDVLTSRTAFFSRSQVLLKNMSKTNPVILNDERVTEAGAELKDGDEVVFPQGEDEKLVFKFVQIVAPKGDVIAAVKSFGSPAPIAEPRSPLGERNNGEAAPAKSPAKEATPAKSPLKAATPAKSPAKAATPAKSPAKAATPAKSPAKAATPAKSPAKAATPAKSPAKATTPAKSPAKSAKKAATPAQKSPAKAQTPKSATPCTKASRALVASAVENLVRAEADAQIVEEDAVEDEQMAASPISTGPTPHTKASRALVASAVENLVRAEEAENAAPEAKSPKASSAKKSPAPAGPTPHTRAARDIVAAAVDAVVAGEMMAEEETAEEDMEEDMEGEAKDAVTEMNGAPPVEASVPPASPCGIPKSPRPSLKAPEARIAAQPPGSVSRRKSLRFVSDDAMEQVRFIPAHNGEPEVCGRIAPNVHISLEKRKRTPNKRYSNAGDVETHEEDSAADAEVVNRIGDVGHTGPIPKFSAIAAGASPVPAPSAAVASPGTTGKKKRASSSGRKRVAVASPIGSGASAKRTAVSFAIGRAEVTDDVAGTPAEGKSGSKFAKRKGTPAPPSRGESVDEDEDEDEEDAEMAVAEEEVTEEESEEDAAEPTNVTVVEEGILGSGRTDGAPPSSIARTEDEDMTMGDESTLGDSADDIPVFRLGDVGNTGPIPHYSPACKASPSAGIVQGRLSTIKSAAKTTPGGSSTPGGSTPRSTTPASRRSSGRVTRRSSVAASTPGSVARPAAPANTPAAGAPEVTFAGSGSAAKRAAAALAAGLSSLAQTPGGHAKLSAVSRILAEEEVNEAAVNVTVEEEAFHAVNVTVEEEIEGAAEIVASAEQAAADEAAEAAALAGATASKAVEDDEDEEEEEDVEAVAADEEEPAPAEPFDFDEAFASEAALVAEGVADVEAAEEIEAALEAAPAATPEKVAAWLNANLAESNVVADVVEAAVNEITTATPASKASPAAQTSPETEIIKARGGSAGAPLARGGLSGRVAQLHRALRATRAALLRERQVVAKYEKMLLSATSQTETATEAAALAAAEVAEAAGAAAESAATAAKAEAATAAAEAKAAEALEAAKEAKAIAEAEKAKSATLEAKIAALEAAAAAHAKDAVSAEEPDAPASAEPTCKVCGCEDDRDAILCDGCDGAFHLGCLKPKLRKIPAGDWFCKSCKEERKPAPAKRGRAAKAEETADEEEASAPKRGRRAAVAPEPPAGTRRSTRARK